MSGVNPLLPKPVQKKLEKVYAKQAQSAAKAVKKEVKKEVAAVVAAAPNVMGSIQNWPTAAQAASANAGFQAAKKNMGNALAKAYDATVPPGTSLGSGVTNAALSLALPLEEKPCHLGDPAGAIMTAVSKTFVRDQVPFAPANCQIEQGGAFCVLRKVALAGSISPVFKETGIPASNQVYFRPGASDHSAVPTCVRSHGTNGSLPFVYSVYTAGPAFDVGSPVQYAATMNGDQSTDRFLYFDNTELRFDFELSGAAAATDRANVTYEVFKFDGKQVSLLGLVQQSRVDNGEATQATLGITAGYIMIRCNVTILTTAGAPSEGTVAISVSSYNASVNMQVVHYPVEDLAEYMGAVEGLRVNAASLLWTNTTPAIDRGGEIVGFQPAPGQNWLHLLYHAGQGYDESPFEALSSEAGSVVLDATNGMYACSVPCSTTEVLNFGDEFSTSGAEGYEMNITDSYYPLIRGNSADLFLAWLCPSGSTGVLTKTSVVEWTTDKQFYEKRYPDVSWNELQAAIRLLSAAPHFTENPKHIASMHSSLQPLANFGRDLFSLSRGALSGVRTLNKEGKQTLREFSPKLADLMKTLLG